MISVCIATYNGDKYIDIQYTLRNRYNGRLY